MGRLIKGDKVDTMPCSLADLNEYNGWNKLDLPEPLQTAPRPDTPKSGSKS